MMELSGEPGMALLLSLIALFVRGRLLQRQPAFPQQRHCAVTIVWLEHLAGCVSDSVDGTATANAGCAATKMASKTAGISASARIPVAGEFLSMSMSLFSLIVVLIEPRTRH
jgi:hypothetical protein